MPDLDKFINEFSEWKGTISADVKNICNKLDATEQERKESKKEFWDRMNNISTEINKTKTEMKVMKTKFGIFTGIIATGITISLNWLMRQLK